MKSILKFAAALILLCILGTLVVTISTGVIEYIFL